MKTTFFCEDEKINEKKLLLSKKLYTMKILLFYSPPYIKRISQGISRMLQKFKISPKSLQNSSCTFLHHIALRNNNIGIRDSHSSTSLFS